MSNPLPSVLVFMPEADDVRDYGRLLGEAFPEGEFVLTSTAEAAMSAIAEAEIVLGWKFAPGLFSGAQNLRWVHKISAGVEDLTQSGVLPPGVRLTRSPGGLIAPRMIEYVLGAIYMKTQRFEQAGRQQSRREWRHYRVDRAAGKKTVGLAGLGDIGGAIARALAANGMRVLGWRRAPAHAEAVERVYAGPGELNAFVAECDFVVSVLPTTKETTGIFSAEVFAAMRRDAVFINVGRGASVDEAALAEAIRSGTIAGAVLDVFVEEPLPQHSPLWTLDNVTITPHVAGPLLPEEVFPHFAENLVRYHAGRPLLREIDIDLGY